MTQNEITHAPKKSLGQHFLRCDWVVSTMLNTAEITSTDTIMEIGPGTGALTRSLAKKALRVIAIEKDESLALKLESSLRADDISNVAIHAADILAIEWMPYIREASTYKIVADIPYYITAQLIRRILECEHPPECIVLMVQYEVAKRIIATAPDGNLFGLSVQAYAVPTFIKTVPASCFTPPPKIASAIIKIVPRKVSIFKENGILPDFFFEIARLAFGQKRKMLSNSLRNIGTLPEWATKKRPQALSLDEWITLVLHLSRDRA